MCVFFLFRYAVFGLGCSAYPHFCAFAKRLDSYLATLGGSRMIKLVKKLKNFPNFNYFKAMVLIF